MKTTLSLLRETFSAWSGHDAQRMAAALAFYTVLSLAPLMILVVAILALIFEKTTAQNHLLQEVGSLLGSQGADAVKSMIEHAQNRSSGTFASIVGVITLLWGASGVFGELRAALNGIWDVKIQDASGVWGTIRQKFFAFGMVLAVGFLLLVSLVISAGLAALGKFLQGLLPLPEFVLGTINFVISLAATSGLFALIFRYVPDQKIPWRDIWKGATATAFLFTVGKFLIGLYLGKAAVGSPYGAAGSLVVIIVWVYYSAMLFLFGAEFTHIMAVHDEPASSAAAA